MGSTVAPEKILKQLADLWVSEGGERRGDSTAGLLRACSMTLLVISEESDDAQQLGETIAALIPEHPSRTILIRLQESDERSLAERVYSQCWMPFGQRRQICCEMVEITASGAAVADLPSLVLPLAVPDLPLIVWCRSRRLVEMAEFRQIAGMAHKVILDSGRMESPSPAAAICRVAEIARRGILLADLSWTRLTRWREMLAQIFENRTYAQRLPGISNVAVKCAPGFYVSALYLQAWARNCLAAAGAVSELAMAPAPEGISLGVRLFGGGFSVELARQGARMVTTIDGISQCTNLPEPSDYLLMREELGIVRRDPVFAQTLDSAAKLAYPTNK